MAKIQKVYNGHTYTFEVTRAQEIAKQLLDFDFGNVKFFLKAGDMFRTDIFAEYFTAYNKNNIYAKPYSINKEKKFVCSLYYDSLNDIVTYRSEQLDQKKLVICVPIINLLEDRDDLIIKATRGKFYDIYRIKIAYLKKIMTEILKGQDLIFCDVDKSEFNHISYQKIKLKKRC